jgi:hypothetical protein
VTEYVRRTHFLIILGVVACGDRGLKDRPAARGVAAAENSRKPAGDAEVGVYCRPSLDKLKTGDTPLCTYLVRWTGEPPLYRDDPYYHAPMKFVSSDSSILGPQFPVSTRVFADSSVRPPTTPWRGAPLYAHKPGRATLTVTVHDKTVTLPVRVEAAPVKTP